MGKTDFPNPDELQKEFEDFVNQRFGGSVQVFSHSLGSSGNQIKQENPPENLEEEKEKSSDSYEFSMTPKEVKQELDRFIVKQHEAKKALAISVCDHYNHINSLGKDRKAYHKQNVLILGPTGVGKTYLIRKLAELVGVPFVKADATRFSETGYVGANVDDLIRDLVAQADGNVSKAERGIVYVDEADKLASAADAGTRQVNGRGVQFGLLRLMEEADVDLKAGNDMQSQIQAMMDFQKGKKEKSLVNTKGILFIVSGAFTGLEDIIAKRISQNTMGFANRDTENIDKDKVISRVTTEDLIKFGLEPEFVGRLPTRVACEELGIKELYKILKEAELSVIDHYKASFTAYGIKVTFTDEALWEVAKLAYQQKTGARALQSVLEETLRDFKFELPSLPHITELLVDKKVIESPIDSLKALIDAAKKPHSKSTLDWFKNYEKSYYNKFCIYIQFTNEGISAIKKQAKRSGQEVQTTCDEVLNDCLHGFNLIKNTSGQSVFTIGNDFIESPKAFLEKMIADSLSQAPREKPDLHSPQLSFDSNRINH